jgi:adenosylcobinamide-GDP ribazoletransferase
MSFRADLASALLLLTRLPAGWLLRGQPPSGLADSVWAFPAVGALAGGVGAATYWVCVRLGLPPALGAVWTLAALLLATGALHEDGLADTADGFGGGGTRARKLEIMRDSRIGAFGALALMLSLAARGGAIVALASPAHVGAALVASGALGRAAILIVLLLLPPARADGLAAGLRQRPLGRSAAGLAFAAVLALALGAGWAILAAAAVPAAIAWVAWRQVGGYTGDVLGAASVVTECAVLSLLAAG